MNSSGQDIKWTCDSALQTCLVSSSFTTNHESTETDFITCEKNWRLRTEAFELLMRQVWLQLFLTFDARCEQKSFEEARNRPMMNCRIASILFNLDLQMSSLKTPRVVQIHPAQPSHEWKRTKLSMVQNKFLSNPKKNISQLARNLKYELKTYIHRQLIVIHLLVLKHWIVQPKYTLFLLIYHIFVFMIVKEETSFPGSTFYFSYKFNNQIHLFIRHFLDLKLPFDVTPLAMSFSMWPFR
jgi:hypothetical protein